MMKIWGNLFCITLETGLNGNNSLIVIAGKFVYDNSKPLVDEKTVDLELFQGQAIYPPFEPVFIKKLVKNKFGNENFQKRFEFEIEELEKKNITFYEKEENDREGILIYGIW